MIAKTLGKLSLVTSLLAASAFSLHAQESADQMKLIEQRLNALEKKSTSGLKLKGVIQMDTAFYSVDDDISYAERAKVKNGIHFRRLRLDARGDVHENISYRLQLDFNDEEVSYTNVHLDFRFSDFNLRLGNTKMPQGHEYMRGSSSIYFVTRSLSNETFTVGRGTGLEVTGDVKKRMSYQAGVYTDATGSRGSDERSVLYAGARLTGLLLDQDEKLIHIGGHFLASSEDSDPRFRGGIESRVSRFRPIDTGTISDSKNVDRYGLEFMGLFSTFRFHYEYSGAKVKDRDVSAIKDVSFSGHTFELATSLTGDTRSYGRGSGSLKGLHPSKPWRQGGIGAFELGARFSTLDLNDSENSTGGIQGGEGTSMTASLAWIPVKNTVFAIEAGQTELEGVNTYADQKIGHYQLRAQVDF